jgi:hypothetical protein
MNNFFDCIVRATKVNGMIVANIVEVFNLLDFEIVYSQVTHGNFTPTFPQNGACMSPSKQPIPLF